jgi:hypothetical protein
MATIPLGDFGQAVARPGPLANIPRGDPIGDAAQRLGGVAQSIDNDIASQNLKRQQDAKNAAAALALAQTNNAMHDAHDQVALGVQQGTIPVDKAPGELQTRIGKIRDEALGGFADPTQRGMMDAHLQNTEGELQRSLVGAVQKRQQHDAAAGIDAFGEQMGREASRSGPEVAVQRYSAYVRTAGPLAALDDKTQQKLVQTFSDKAHNDFYTNAGVAALTNGDDAALRTLREQLNGPAGDPVDPHRRAILTHTLFGWEQSILAKRDRAANQAEADALRQRNEAAEIFNKGTDVALGGGYFSPEFIQQMVTTAAGTEMAGPVNNLIASQRTVAGFASLPATLRDATIERMRNARATPGVGTDPLGEKLLSAMGAMNDKLKHQAEENPWAAAQQAGVIKDAPVLNLADPATAVQAIGQRMQQISAVEAWTGQRASPLQPQEVEQLGKFVRQLPLDQAASMLANIGGALGNEERVAALGKQLHDKDGSLGLAMMFASAQTTQGRKTAELVLRGEQALKDNSALVDKAAETGWKASIAKAIRGAYSNPEAESQTIDAAFKILAANYADGKGADVDNAVNLATGGIIERNGQKVPLPYGMKEGDFEKKLEAIRAPDLAAQAPGGQVFIGRTPMPLEQFVATLPKASLVHAGQGQYNVRAGTGIVTNAQGKRITLRIAP